MPHVTGVIVNSRFVRNKKKSGIENLYSFAFNESTNQVANETTNLSAVNESINQLTNN